MNRLVELALVFLKQGTIGFGGPAAHIAMMEDELVTRREWLSRQEFLDLVGATNLIPGPNSTEIAIHIGRHRAGWLGLLVAGISFIVPAVLITTLFAYIYVEFGSLPQMAPAMEGIKPAVLAIILSAGWKLGKQALKDAAAWLIAGTALTASLFGADVVWTLLVVSLVGTIVLGWRSRPKPVPPAGPAAIPLGMQAATTTAVSASAAGAVSYWQLGLVFLKIGAVLYGSGYVLIAYLEGEFVANRGWLTNEQVFDAIAIGQFTPGPILSTATFIGYVMMSDAGPRAGLAGAAIATAGIFLPSFFFVAITGPIIPKLRQHRITGCFLDAVNAASLGLMAAVIAKLTLAVFLESVDPLYLRWSSVGSFAIAAMAVLRWKVSAVWIVLTGALAGYGLSFIM